MSQVAGEILTVGHSTRGPGELEELLALHGVESLIDVRRHPGSRRMPHFGSEALEQSLRASGVAYVHVPELGGRRRPVPDSPNGGWEKDSFRAYADHMASAEFERGLNRAMDHAERCRACIMCAEAPWWRCHRRLVADALVVREWAVLHVMSSAAPARHELTDFAVVEGSRLVYPPAQESLPTG